VDSDYAVILQISTFATSQFTYLLPYLSLSLSLSLSLCVYPSAYIWAELG